MSAIRTYDHDSEGCPEKQGSPHECNGSADEYESEEDMIVPRSHNPSTAGLHVLGIHEAASRLCSSDNGHRVYPTADEGVIERMQIEMLRRQAADAISVSLRISDQLAEAQAEAARAKAALRATEGLLEEEGRKRREAERIASEENRLRRIAEETFRLQNQVK